jgi:GNAT superfamily N-acetyltransferase
VRLSRPQPLQPHHDLSSFCCGDRSVDNWIRRRAHSNAVSRLNRIVVVIDEDTQQVAGIYALTFKQLARDALGAFQSKGIKDGPPLIPAYFIGQFAVATTYQKQGLAGGLVKDIFQFLLEEAERGIPAPLIYLDASQEQAASFWHHMGFTPCPELGRNAMVKDLNDIAETAEALDHPDTKGKRVRMVTTLKWVLYRAGLRRQSP